MMLDSLLLIAAGILAILAGAAVFLLGREQYPSLLSAAALISLGLLQFGWARTVSNVAGGETWFELSLAFALPVSLVWVLLSRTLCLVPGTGHTGLWRIYILIQALSAVAALVVVGLSAAPIAGFSLKGATAFPLRPATNAMIVGITLNLVLAAAGFESTYLSLASGPRRAFRLGLLGILFGAASFGYTAIAGLASGYLSSADISLGWIPVAALAFALAYSLLRGRLVEVHVRRKALPLLKTTSIALSVGFLVLMAVFLWVIHATGWSIARGLWIISACTAALGITALTISNRINRRFQRLIDPLRYRGSIDREEISERVHGATAEAQTVPELCQLIPGNVREFTRTNPVTLFLLDPRASRYVAVASTLEPMPNVAVSPSEPLATELDRTRRAILLRGRNDDLEYIPIYVENAAQITACAASCAAPILRSEELAGFLLCGAQAEEDGEERPLLPLLDLICALYSTRLEGLEAEIQAARPGVTG